jgi:hypothetical protein
MTKEKKNDFLDPIVNFFGEIVGTSKDEILLNISNRSLDEDDYDKFPPEVWKEIDIIRMCIMRGNNPVSILEYIDESVWCNKKLVREIILWKWKGLFEEYDLDYWQHDWLEYIHESLHDDKNIKVDLIYMNKEYSKYSN